MTLYNVCENDIYAYTPADGSVSFVYAAKEFEEAVESHMGVDESGLYLFCSKRGREIVSPSGGIGHLMEDFYYLLPFGSSEVEEDPMRRALSGWGDYYYHAARLSLVRRGTSGNEDVISFEAPAARCCIIGDNYYSVSSSAIALYITDILTGEIKSYECKSVIREILGSEVEKEDVSWVQSFTVTEDYVWMIVKGKYLVRIEPESGEMKSYVMKKSNYYIDKLYTEGRNLYARYKPESFFDPGYLIQIKTEEVLGTSPLYGVEELGMEYLTE